LIKQLSLGDYQVNKNRKATRTEIKLGEIEQHVDWGYSQY